MGIREFDAVALHKALDAQRTNRGLSWRQVADEIWEQSAELNRQRQDHPISPSTLSAIAKRGDTSCQHALFVLRWLGCAPECFLSPPRLRESDALPAAGPDRRLRWDLPALYAALDAKRRQRELTWVALARELRCSANQLQGIRTARYTIGMKLAMRLAQWLDRSASSFVYVARW